MKIKTLAHQFQLKSLESDGTFTGYGSVFGNEDSYGDIVEKGAFKASLAEWEKRGTLPSLLWQHKHDEPIGIYTKMAEDDHGLLVEGKLLIDDDPLAKRAYAHLRAKSVQGLSIGYSVPKGGGEYDEGAGVYRLNQVKLWEVSLVTFPANEQAQVDTVKASDFIENIRDAEIFLRDAGFSRSQAKALLSGGFDGMKGLRDAAPTSESKTAAQILENLFKSQKG